MTKLEEVTALLVNEINDFNQSIEKLDEINNQLKETKIKMDIKEYRSLVEKHQDQMVSHQDFMDRFESRFENKIKQAKVYPTWVVVVFIISILLGVILVLHVFFF